VALRTSWQPGAGADAVIRSGGNMRLSVDELNNSYAQIAAGGNLQIVGHGADSRVSNVGLELFRTHTFNNTPSPTTATNAMDRRAHLRKDRPAGGQITANGTLSIDVGDLSNSQPGAQRAERAERFGHGQPQRAGARALPDGPGHGGAQGPGQSTGTGAERAGTGGRCRRYPAGRQRRRRERQHRHVWAARGRGPVADRRIASRWAHRTRAPSASLFNVNPNGGHYLVETDPRFTDHKTWLSSDHLLGQMGYSPDTVQKRLGDGYYEQKLVREQIGQLTGRRFLDGSPVTRRSTARCWRPVPRSPANGACARRGADRSADGTADQ
jgi:filamentous hemagglutinin